MGGRPRKGVVMATTNANEPEAHLRRALQAAARLFLALEEIEAGGGLAPPWPAAAPGAGRKSSPAYGRRGTSSTPCWGGSTRRPPARPAGLLLRRG